MGWLVMTCASWKGNMGTLVSEGNMDMAWSWCHPCAQDSQRHKQDVDGIYEVGAGTWVCRESVTPAESC